MTRLDPSEAGLQESIAKWLRLTGWLVLEYGKPGGHRELKGAVAPGHPDLLAIKKGRHVFLEIKAAKGKVSIYQAWMISALEDHGAKVRVVRSLDEAMEVMR